MPTFRVTDPDSGVKVKITGDSPPTEQELEEIFSSISPRQDNQALTRAGRIGGGFAGPSQAPQQTEPEQQFPQEASETRAARNLPELFESGLLQGQPPAKVAQFAAIASVTPDPQELGEIATNMFPDIGMQQDPGGNILLANNQTGAQTIINRPGASGTDAAQIGAGMLAFTPASRAGIGVLGQGGKQAIKQGTKGAAAGGTTQSAIETGQEASGGQFDPGNVVLAGVAQPLAQAGGEKLGQQISKATIGRPRPEAQQVIEAGKREGVDVFTSDVEPFKGFVGNAIRDFSEKIPLIGTGGRRAKQQAQREKLIFDLADNTPQVSDEKIIQELRRSTNTQKKRAGQTIAQINKQMQAEGEVPIDQTLKKIYGLIDRFQQPGRPKEPEAVNLLRQMFQNLTESPQTFETLRENRRWLWDKIDTPAIMGDKSFTSNAGRLMKEVARSVDNDMKQFVRNRAGKARAEDFKVADRVYRDLAEDATKTRLKTVLEKGQFKPETVESLLFSSKPSEQRVLFKNLTPEGRAHSRAALINRAIEKAGGVDDMTPNRLQTNIKKLEDGIDTFFQGEEKKRLKGIERLLKATRRAQDFSVTTPTGQSQLVPQSLGMIGATLKEGENALKFVVGAPVVMGARVYEHPIVRNALIRLSNTEPASRAEIRALEEAGSAISTTVQAMRNQETENQAEQQNQSEQIQEAL